MKYQHATVLSYEQRDDYTKERGIQLMGINLMNTVLDRKQWKKLPKNLSK